MGEVMSGKIPDTDFGPVDPSGIDCSPLLDAHRINVAPTGEILKISGELRPITKIDHTPDTPMSACIRFSLLSGKWIIDHNDERPYSQVMADAGLRECEEKLEWIIENGRAEGLAACLAAADTALRVIQGG